MRKQGKKENLIPQDKGNKLAEKPFDKRQFEALCRIHCTEKEITDILGYKSHETLNAKLLKEYGGTFEQVYPEFSSQGKASLRRMQWKNAEEGNTSMLIWLGKQHLGQKDKQEMDINTPQSLQFVLVGNEERVIDKHESDNAEY